ncbi:ABC transporter permease [Faecalimicrobium sp. JNUCC 81]
MKVYTSFLNNSNRKDKMEIVLSCILLLFLWQIIAILINNEIYLPTINQTLNSMKEIILEPRFYLDMAYSIGRSLYSFLLALVLAMVIGILSYSNKIIRNIIKPISKILESIPTMILVLLVLIWFNKDKAPFIVGFSIVMPILYDAVLGSMLNIDKKLIEMSEIYKININDKVLKLYLPSIKHSLMPIFISTFSLALKVVIAGEVYGQPTYGIGTMIQVEKINFNTSGIFAWIVIILLISVVLDIIQKVLLRRTFIWKR